MQDETVENLTSTLTVSLPQEIKEALEEEAKKQDRSTASLVRIIMRAFISQQKGGHDASSH
jgi:predicted DNA-binding protein